MPTIKVEQELLSKIQAVHGVEHDFNRLVDELPLLGTDITRCDDEMLEIEIFPDRPDLLSGETLAHAIRPFLHGTESQPALDVVDGEVSMDVDAGLAEVRPIILGAIVRGVDSGDSAQQKEDFIKALMDHQEKLHFAIGRGRRRASIGVHDLSTLAPPFRVVCVRGDYSFTPLQMTRTMSIDEILSQHDKGVDYAHLLEGFDRYPVILDGSDRVLSFPPIINGDHTTVSHSTTDFFIDVTGWDQRACECCLLLICLQLAARGGVIESVRISSCHDEELATPDGSPQKHRVPEELVVQILGHEFSDVELERTITRMGGRYLGREPCNGGGGDRMADASPNGDWLVIEMPRWRFDILHPIDLVEDIAIGHGYEDLGEATPAFPTTAIPRQEATFTRRLRDCLQGLGLQQVQSLTLSNETDQFSAVRIPAEGEVTTIKNPITGEHTILRQSILPSLLRLLSANRRHELPQRVYESGICVRDHKNRNRIAWLCAEQVSSFSQSRGMVQALLRDLGTDSQELDVSWETVALGEGPWMKGRSAKILISGKEVGQMGEIDPVVGDHFELRVPMHAAEFDIEALRQAIRDPVL